MEEVERFVGLRNRTRLAWETRKEEERVIEHAMAAIAELGSCGFGRVNHDDRYGPPKLVLPFPH